MAKDVDLFLAREVPVGKPPVPNANHVDSRAIAHEHISIAASALGPSHHLGGGGHTVAIVTSAAASTVFHCFSNGSKTAETRTASRGSPAPPAPFL
jgi:hypothetical protein